MVLVSDNFVFSKCEKYVVVWAYPMGQKNRLGYVFIFIHPT